GVDEDVAVVALVELDLATHSGDAEGIAVAADTGDDASHQVPSLFVFRCAEAEGVHRCNRPRAHGGDGAQNSAHTGPRTLVGLDAARVDVCLHLEHDGLALAGLDHGGVLALALDFAWSGSRQRLQPLLRALVRAVLVTH